MARVLAIAGLPRARVQGREWTLSARCGQRHLGHRTDPDDLTDATSPRVPDEIRRLAEARREARADRRFAEADALKAQLEAAGWRVVDVGRTSRLSPLHPPDVVEAARTRYGWSGAVPLRDAAPGTHVATVILVATDAADDLERQLAALAGSVDDDVQRIVVANGPSAEQETALVGWEGRWMAEARESDAEVDDVAAATEVVWLASRLGSAAAINAGVRRAAGEIVILLGPGVEPTGDLVSPLLATFADSAVAVAGPWGLVSHDQRHFESAAEGAPVAAIDVACLAFRRADAADRGPLDERFEGDALLGAWWSLVLRDAGEDRPSRRATVVDVPVVRRAAASDGEDPAERRNRYRLIDRFGNRTDLAVP